MNNRIAMRSHILLKSVLGGLIVLAACADKEVADAELKFPVTNPIVTDTLYTSDYVADIHSIQNVELRARVSGYMDKVHVDEGAFVKKGQLLFTLGGQEYREDLVKAKATLKSAIADSKSAEVELRSVERLVQKNIVSTSELEIAQSKLDALKAKIEEAKSQEASASIKLSLTEIRAPFDGIIDRIPNKVGSLISEGELLTTISDNRQVYAYFNVSEQEYLDYATSEENGKKSEVVLILANSHFHESKGVVETVEGRIDKNTGNIAFRAKFNNESGLLKEGSSGKVRLQRKLKNALIIPQKATFEIQDKLFVFVVDDQNVVHMKSLVPKFRLPHSYIVEEGLSVKDRILFEGIQLVKEGDKICPEQVDFNKDQAHLAKQ
jgi:RND family efflux transporter MFP subunit